MADWTQLGKFLGGYACTGTAPLGSCAPSDAFILADKSGPATPLFTQGSDTVLNTPQLLASAGKVHAAAAILNTLYAHNYTVGTSVTDIVNAYLQSNSDSDATHFKAAWDTLTQALTTTYGTPPITMGQLLSMTSGFATLKPDPSNALKLLDKQPPCTNDLDIVDSYTQISLAACAKQIADVQYIVFKPGSTFGYSDVSYQLAGYVATLVAGPTYAGHWSAFFHDTFAQPLGLTSYCYDNDLQATHPTPSPCTNNPSAYLPNPRVAGGASCSAHDYSVILSTILDNGSYNGATVLKSTVVGLLETNQLPAKWLENPNSPDDGMGAVYFVPGNRSSSRATPSGCSSRRRRARPRRARASS